MFLKQFKLSQQEKEKLIRVKSQTGIQNWNILCRWAFAWSLAQNTIPEGVEPLSDSNVEMSWQTFGGEYDEVYEAILRERCIQDGLGDSNETLIKYFRLHLYRGICYFSKPGSERSLMRFLKETISKETDEEYEES